MPRFALNFISGKYKGDHYTLPEGKEVSIGRSSDVDLTLAEVMVSRKHAIVTLENNQVRLKDLESRNGTFVNGRKISEAVVTVGDRVLIGTSIMRLIETRLRDNDFDDGYALTSENDFGSTIVSNCLMTGSLSELPLPDLMQMFSSTSKSGTLIIKKDGVMGRLYLHDGQMKYASALGVCEDDPFKAFCRILSWGGGMFELLPLENKDYATVLDKPTENLLMESLVVIDEIQDRLKRLPALEVKMKICIPLKPRLADLDENELDVVQQILEEVSISDLMEDSTLSDVDMLTVLVKLFEEEYIYCDEPFEGQEQDRIEDGVGDDEYEEEEEEVPV